MSTKLTLTIDDSVIEKAKKYAKNKEKSLSSIVENYLKVLVKEQSENKIELTPIVKSLKSTFHSDQDFDYKQELSKKLSEKYL
jgi:BioD-like phosphotransacetylase family protein